MMDISYKNKLQEFCHRQKIDLPKYATQQVLDGSFHCDVSIVYQGKEYNAWGNDKRKVLAEQQAAEGLCMILNSYIKSGNLTLRSSLIQQFNHQYKQQYDPKIVDLSNKKVYVLVDLENITHGLDEMFHKYQFTPSQNIVFHGFLSFGHHNAKKEYIFTTPSGVQYNFVLHKIDSSRRDACDVALIMEATRIALISFSKKLAKEKTLINSSPSPPSPNSSTIDVMVVASGDKFAPALMDAINTGYLGLKNEMRAVHASNADEIGFRLMSLD